MSEYGGSRYESQYLNSIFHFSTQFLAISSQTNISHHGDCEASLLDRYLLPSYNPVIILPVVVLAMPVSLCQSSLSSSVPGVPGEDYPVLSSPPATSFTCLDRRDGGYYADQEAGCQG